MAEYEYLTPEQVLDEIDLYGSKFVAEGARKRYKIDGTLPDHALKVSLGLEPVIVKIGSEPIIKRYRRKKEE